MADRVALMGQVARMYYEEAATQEEIGRRLGISRPTVSRLLQDARNEGIVRIIIQSPLATDGILETALRHVFPDLKQAVVVRPSGGEPDAKGQLGQAAADFLLRRVQDGDGIGIGWGSTMAEVAEALAAREPAPRRGVTVVQLSGGISRAEAGTNAAQVVERFGQAFGAAAHFLPVPAIVDSTAVHAALVSDRQVANLLDLGRRVPLAVFSIGVPRPDSVMVAAGYLAAADIVRLNEVGAVGDILGRYFDHTGAGCDPALDQRTVGLELDHLRRKPLRVAVAGGAGKATAILGALRGGFINVLITDAEAANGVLRMAGAPLPRSQRRGADEGTQRG